MRFVVEKGSATAHCCFEASVIDSKSGEVFCECMDEVNAILIAETLEARFTGATPEIAAQPSGEER